MEKQFKVSGMMCQHCRMHVEKALNKLEGVSATVTLDPPVATVKFSGKTYYAGTNCNNRSRKRPVNIR